MTTLREREQNKCHQSKSSVCQCFNPRYWNRIGALDTNRNDLRLVHIHIYGRCGKTADETADEFHVIVPFAHKILQGPADQDRGRFKHCPGEQAWPVKHQNS